MPWILLQSIIHWFIRINYQLLLARHYCPNIYPLHCMLISIYISNYYSLPFDLFFTLFCPKYWSTVYIHTAEIIFIRVRDLNKSMRPWSQWSNNLNRITIGLRHRHNDMLFKQDAGFSKPMGSEWAALRICV